MVDPLHRRRGIAEKLQIHIEQMRSEEGVELVHLDIIEDNLPSIRLFCKMGFKNVLDYILFSLFPRKKLKTGAGANVRSMNESDLNELLMS